ncbi:AAA family ATPase [Anaeromicropila populeti]|uniref:AAA domain-containing protein n=1 Tax=Anaeromicropila populeti TaxID=37658 RepID=A0A1I6HYF3_9FIRM|nr:AAA family ATPase [Anaeromicropila populeti]SFR59473.1 AAA domain-containing protein [Anaeromicropila populeti]
MIDRVHIYALKSIREMTVNCSNLNIFVGTNSSGKSTFLQAILLAAQNSTDKMGLNGKLISLGEFREVRNYYMNHQNIKIEWWKDNENKPAWVEFVENKDNETYSISCSEEGEMEIPLTYKTGFHYLSCHRIGANDIYAKNMMDDTDFGIDGEYSLAYLLKNEGKPLADKLSIKNEGLTDSFLDQVNYWLEYIIGMTLSIRDLKKTNYLQVKYNNNLANMSSDALFARPVNVGSGVSYLFCIIHIGKMN